MHSELHMMQEDCEILLNRALLGKTIAAFGIDGFGEHGQSREAKHFTVSDIIVLVTNAPGPTGFTGRVMIELADYCSIDCGYVATDRNIEISINTFLKEQDISPACWSWAEIKYQGDNFIFLELDVEQLLFV